MLALVSMAQAFFLIRADTTARTSAEASGRAADAAREAVQVAQRQFVATVRPHLVIRQVGRFERDDGTTVEFVVANAGASSARIVESRVVVVLQHQGKPLPLQRFNEAHPTAGPIILAAGEAGIHWWADAAKLDLGNNFATAALFVVGYIVYEDAAAIRRRVGYCRQFERETGRFRTLEDPDYEYAD